MKYYEAERVSLEVESCGIGTRMKFKVELIRNKVEC